MRFSGHETFPFRYAWLPKAYHAISEDPEAFADDERAMEALGLGKNMVNALRFWVDATGVANAMGGREFELTSLGNAIFGADGHDPFLEDTRTLWILHWKIASHRDPLFAWEFLLNSWHHPEICRSDVLVALQREAPPQPRTLSAVTIAQHFDVFLRSYLAHRARSGGAPDEDVLDCPLAGLRLVEQVGERCGASGKTEPVYRFRRESKPEITPWLFAWCLDDFWTRRHGDEQTLTLRQVAVGHGSPGQVLKLPEEDLRQRLERIESDTRGTFSFRASAATPSIIRGKRRSDLLANVYRETIVDA